ncbi:acyl-CoA dehydrogenase family protein [Ramlibacter sp.]|uniref:acyl-CoA dehydrogenase family protein n=1 Tax=Ramlibacter sp. TaxID=1917967 RepID=UPI003D135BB7
MDFSLTPEQIDIQRSVESICARYDLNYWAQRDAEESFPEEFFQDMVKGGYTAITLPAEQGGAGLGIETAAVVMQTIAESGAGMSGASTVHSYVFIPKAIALHGSEAQKARMLPPLISGEERACLGITEPDAGIDTTRLRYRAVKQGDHYLFSGEKVWPTMGSTADRVLLIARTTPIEQCKRPIDGLSLFYTKLDRRYVEAKKIPKLGRNTMESCQLHFQGLPIPEEDRIGEEGKGLYYLFDGLNPERIMVAAEAIGLARAALRLASNYANERVVFGRPIGQNQGVQHPLAESWMKVETANLMMHKAASLYDAGRECGAEANTAKYMCAEAAFEACTRALMTFGGYGYAKEFHVERLMREALLTRLVPVSPNLVLCYIAERVLGLTKSY